MARRRRGLSRGLALVAACMLVLQSMVHAFAGQAPDIRPFDAFGNLICIGEQPILIPSMAAAIMTSCPSAAFLDAACPRRCRMHLPAASRRF